LTLLLGSSDLMERNLDRRIEVLFPVTDVELQARVLEVLDLNLADDTNSWALGETGTWNRVPTLEGISAQHRLQELARGRARRRRESETLGVAPA
jgi:polyphosphate kinase